MMVQVIYRKELAEWAPVIETSVRSLGVGHHSETLELLELFQSKHGLSARPAPHKRPAPAAVLAALSFCQTHTHYKGGMYEMLASDVESAGEALVAYRRVSGDLWFRPTEMFLGRLGDGRIRFAPLD